MVDSFTKQKFSDALKYNKENLMSVVESQRYKIDKLNKTDEEKLDDELDGAYSRNPRGNWQQEWLNVLNFKHFIQKDDWSITKNNETRTVKPWTEKTPQSDIYTDYKRTTDSIMSYSQLQQYN